MPAPLREALWRLDLQRVGLRVAFFERWLAQAETRQAREEAFTALKLLTQDELLSRLRFETDLIEALFPEAAEECRQLRASLDQLPVVIGRVSGLPAQA